MKILKAYGIQRSGTSFLSLCMLQNFENCLILKGHELGYKHGKPVTIDGIYQWFEEGPKRFKNHKITDLHREIAKDLRKGKTKLNPCVIIKNPYSWHWSIGRWKIKNGWIAKPEKHYPKNYKSFNNFYRKWRDLIKYGNDVHTTGIFVKYEDLIMDTEFVISMMASYFDVEVSRDLIIPTKISHSDTFTEEQKRFYLQDGNFGLSNEQVKWITDNIDWDLMKYYGYEPLAEG